MGRITDFCPLEIRAALEGTQLATGVLNETTEPVRSVRRYEESESLFCRHRHKFQNHSKTLKHIYKPREIWAPTPSRFDYATTPHRSQANFFFIVKKNKYRHITSNST